MKFSSLVLIGLSIGFFSCAKSEATPSTPQGVAATAAGNEGPNGGNFEAQEVARLSGELLMILKQSASTYPEVDVQKFETALLKTKLFVVPVIFENGRELDASNNGTDEIKINQMRWRLKTNGLEKMALLFHEYLGILGLERDSYAISNRLLNPLTNLTRATFYQCDDSYDTRIKVRYDTTGDIFFFDFADFDRAKYADECKGCDPVGQLSFVKQIYAVHFGGLHAAFRKSGDKLLRLDGSVPEIPLHYGWTQMVFLDGMGITLTALPKNADSMSCYPLQ